jgi:hypothetical protein
MDEIWDACSALLCSSLFVVKHSKIFYKSPVARQHRCASETTEVERESVELIRLERSYEDPKEQVFL